MGTYFDNLDSFVARSKGLLTRNVSSIADELQKIKNMYLLCHYIELEDLKLFANTSIFKKRFLDILTSRIFCERFLLLKTEYPIIYSPVKERSKILYLYNMDFLCDLDTNNELILNGHLQLLYSKVVRKFLRKTDFEETEYVFFTLCVIPNLFISFLENAFSIDFYFASKFYLFFVNYLDEIDLHKVLLFPNPFFYKTWKFEPYLLVRCCKDPCKKFLFMKCLSFIVHAYDEIDQNLVNRLLSH